MAKFASVFSHAVKLDTHTVHFKILMSPWIVSRCEICVAQMIVSAGHTLSPCLNRREAMPSLCFTYKGRKSHPWGSTRCRGDAHFSPHCDENHFTKKVSETFGIQLLNKSDSRPTLDRSRRLKPRVWGLKAASSSVSCVTPARSHGRVTGTLTPKHCLQLLWLHISPLRPLPSLSWHASLYSSCKGLLKMTLSWFHVTDFHFDSVVNRLKMQWRCVSLCFDEFKCCFFFEICWPLIFISIHLSICKLKTKRKHDK